jgi:hypoxanthine phosphoribosyltransferase
MHTLQANPQLRVLWSAEQIQARVQELGKQITSHYLELLAPGEELILIGLLKGSIVFTADLMRAIDLPIRLELMAVSSYGSGKESTQDVRIQQDVDVSLTGRHVLIVEDIVDTGRTFSKVLALLRLRGPASLQTATLLNKPCRRVVEVPVDYVGFEVEDHFVVGCGMDHAESYRHLPFIGEVLE